MYVFGSACGDDGGLDAGRREENGREQDETGGRRPGDFVEEGLAEVKEGHLTWRGADGMRPAFGAAGPAVFYLTWRAGR